MSQVPICASTGGLVDTVKEGYTGFHMGDFSVEVSDLILLDSSACSILGTINHLFLFAF